MNWIYLAQDRCGWPAVNAVMNLWKFLDYLETCRLLVKNCDCVLLAMLSFVNAFLCTRRHLEEITH